MATNLPKSASPSEPRTLAQEFLKSVEALLNWMNGNDLSADHAESCPEDYERLNDLLPKFRASIAAEPRRDEREAILTLIDELGVKASMVEHVSDYGTEATGRTGREILRGLSKVRDYIRAARASAAPLNQTARTHTYSVVDLRRIEKYGNELRHALQQRELNPSRGLLGNILGMLERPFLDAASQPSPLECPKCGWTADEGDGQPVKINPDALPQPSAAQGISAAQPTEEHVWPTYGGIRRTAPSAGQTEGK